MSTGRRGGTGRVTISDIAERAGVSIGAVSFALNGRKGVSDETRARILRVADELGWAPSTAARSLAEAKSPTEYLQLQSEIARASFDRAVAETSKLTESLVKLAGETIQPISNRATANAERFNTLVA